MYAAYINGRVSKRFHPLFFALIIVLLAATPLGAHYEAASAGAATSLPAGYIGVWKGDGVQINPSSQWSILFGITNGTIGSIIGTAAYPSLRCGGELTLLNISADSIELLEDITYGNCIDDGIVTLKLLPNNTVDYAWRSSIHPTTATGAMTKISQGGAAIPSEYIGIWRGSGSQPSSQWSILFGLTNGLVGSIIGTTAYPSLNCGGELTLQHINADSIELAEDITYGGNCVDNGVVTLKLLTNNTLSYSWFAPGFPETGTGTLTRISTETAQGCTLANFGDTSGNPIRQNDPLWKDEPYGGADFTPPGKPTRFVRFEYKGYDSNGKTLDTIGAWGCALTSDAMIVNYFAQLQGSSFRTDPKTLNEWLQHHDGYSIGTPKPVDDPVKTDTSMVKHAKVVEYAKENGVLIRPVAHRSNIVWDNNTRQYVEKIPALEFVNQTRDVVNAAICSFNPVLLGVNKDGHFLVGTGKVQDGGVETWNIHDPLWRGAGIEPGITTLKQKYSNLYSSYRVFQSAEPTTHLNIVVPVSGSGTANRQLTTISSEVNVQFVLIDPQGHKTGFDTATNTLLEEIPNSTYAIEALAADGGSGPFQRLLSLDVGIPLTGDYTLQVTGAGNYTIEINGVDNRGTVSSARVSGTVTNGVDSMYRLSFIPSQSEIITVTPQNRTYLPLLVR